MSLRFRKSAKIGPVRFTVSKSGISTSVGVKGFRVTKKANGKVQTAVSIPGTGFANVKEVGTVDSSKTVKSKKKKPFFMRWWFIVIAVLTILYIIGTSGSSEDQEVKKATPTASVTSTLAPRSTVKPEPTEPPVRTYILNPSTNVFHYEWCQHVKRMKEENRVKIESTYDEMIEHGYTPCDTCNPK